MTSTLQWGDGWPLLCICLTLATVLNGQTQGLGGLDIAGTWRFQMDPGDQGLKEQWWRRSLSDDIQLPGTTARASKGERLSIELSLEGEAMRHLHQRFRYVGPAWYQREITIPAAWAGQEVELILERVIWESRVWVNGEEVTAPERSLSTPHRHRIGRLVKPGRENTITLRIDNRPAVDMGILSHAYTDQTQTIWNGAVGRIALVPQPGLRIGWLGLRPDLGQQGVWVEAEVVNETGVPRTAVLTLQASPEDEGPPGEAVASELTVDPGTRTHRVFYPMPRPFVTWSEFTPQLYRLTATLRAGGHTHVLEDTFGMRRMTTDGNRILINGQPTFLRGNLECAIFPETGHPDMTGVTWDKMFRAASAHGLNHLRFHSWCPPKAAFAAADRYGFYLQVELPNWSFGMGRNPPVDAFFKEEGERILREYGNHPSFVMFCLGNELKGDFESMDRLIDHFRSLAPHLLYTSTAFSFSSRGRLPGRSDDIFISQRTRSGWVRGQGFLNQTRPNTRSDYAKGLACLDIPLVTHEVGQYNVFPNLAELPKYDQSPLRATAWESIREDLQAKGRLAEAARYTRDSGKLAALLYKEDLERALRTPGLAGIQLLQLQDFPGQSTATVGLLDAFWDSKGVIEPSAFRRFCAPTVPLARMDKLTWLNDETLVADLEVAHFGAEPLSDVTVRWRLLNGSRPVAEDRIDAATLPLGNGVPLGAVRVPLASVGRAAKLTLEVEIQAAGSTNAWPVWVYPAEPAPDRPADGVHLTDKMNGETLDQLASGRRVILLPTKESFKKPIPARFIPVFWSPLHFPNQPGTLGATIDANHPLWDDFPTGTHTDWQWWELTAQSLAVDLQGLDPAIGKPFRFIDKFNRNALPAAVFEARVGAGKLLVCTLDVSSDLDTRIVAGCLRRTLFDYAASPRFNPRGQLSQADLEDLFETGEDHAPGASEGAPAGEGDVRELGIVPGFND